MSEDDHASGDARDRQKAATRDQITHTWVGGRCLMDNRQLTTLNEALILNNAQQWQEKIAGADRD